MARFVQMLQKSGVFADQNFMIVPQGGFNLVYLRDSAGFQIMHDRRLKVHDVKADQVERIATEYLRAREGSPGSIDRLLQLRTVMHNSVNKSARGKLLQVWANGSGIPVLTAKSGTVSLKLDVAILRRKEYTVSFKFLKHTMPAGALVPATTLTTESTSTWMNKLNWIFGAQANVYFKSIDAAWVTLRTTASQPMTFEEFEQSLIPHKHKDAALTCFLVGKYKGANSGSEAAGTYSPSHKVCVLDDGPTHGIFDDLNFDSFIGVMAHEFTHFAGGNHHNRGRFLMSHGIETLDFDKQLVVELNAW
ncbi:MAG: hypothetical protein H7099_11050 [Gemmatimonadaceae bacterium]|nr:hypothetical protein [Gemmatimonadaceae bacterium]